MNQLWGNSMRPHHVLADLHRIIHAMDLEFDELAASVLKSGWVSSLCSEINIQIHWLVHFVMIIQACLYAFGPIEFEKFIVALSKLLQITFVHISMPVLNR